MHTEDEPSMRAALIALTARLSKQTSNYLYHREYKKWANSLDEINHQESTIVNTFEKIILSEIPIKP